MNFDIKDYKKFLVPMLESFHIFCENHKLKYSIAAGTMLGAIRHKGMIPWDDDIDIFMPRPDYDRFISMTLNDYLPNYKVVSSYNTPTYYLSFAKIIDTRTKLIEYEFCKDCMLGIFIDIFPIDGIPSNKIIREKNYIHYKKTLNKANLSRFKYNMNIGLKTYICNLLHRIYNSQKLFNKCDKISSKHFFDESDEVRSYSSIYGDKEILKRSIFDEYIKVKFEGIDVYCIKEYDYYLTKIYGNYMKLPPKSQQKSQHSHYFIELPVL